MAHRILVVDDDPHLVKVVSMYLAIEGYDVQIAGTAEEGLAEMERQRPDLIIMDIMMPGMDGIEACRRIKSDPDTEAIPVVMFSALSSDDDVERARMAGANNLITKPFSLVKLASVVRDFFDGAVSA